MMRSHYLFLLVYLLSNYWDTSHANNRNEDCNRGRNCPQPGPTSRFLQCVGLSSTDTGKEHMQRLKEILEASMDLYSFMRSSMTDVPLLRLQGALAFKPGSDPFQNEDFIHMWISVKIKPLLNSISKHFLSCLSSRNFTCSSYHTAVTELSHHFSGMDPVRQKWIYTFFMYPFLSGEGVAGCVKPHESSEEWLMKNFGAFSTMARMKDFSALNMAFSGLEVLQLLSPEQKAELLLRPEVQSLDNGTLSLIFHSMLTGGNGSPSTARPQGGRMNGTNSIMFHPYDPYMPASPQHTLQYVTHEITGGVRPIWSLIHEFVTFTRERGESEMRATTLTQMLMNWTLAELARMYQPPIVEEPKFNLENVDDWYQHVVMPIMRRFLTEEEIKMYSNMTMAFHHVFYLENGMGKEEEEEEDICSITLDERPCGLTDAVKNVAHILQCAAISNFTVTEVTMLRLMSELTKRLRLLVTEFSKANISEVMTHFREVFARPDSPALTKENLEDPEFITLWFQIKLLPILPDIPKKLLACLSTKNFTCPVYQTLVAELSRYMQFMADDLKPSYSIYKHFIYPFLMHHNTSEPQCVSSTKSSAEWLKINFGFFSMFASVKDFYTLNPSFSGLDALHLLSPKQTAEMLVLPLRSPPGKEAVIRRVFDFMIKSPEDRKLLEVLHNLAELAKTVDIPCWNYRVIFVELLSIIPYIPPRMESSIWMITDVLRDIAPEECVPLNLTCPTTLYNASLICSGVNSSELEDYLRKLGSADVPCRFPLEEYACAQLDNFTASQVVSLLKCNLPPATRHSRALWKMLLTKLSSVLDRALDIWGDTPNVMVSQSASEILDVVGEMKLSMLSTEQLQNSSITRKWFHHRLGALLPFASASFLSCLSTKNLSCSSYQIILQPFGQHFHNMTSKRQLVILKDFIIPFLSHPQSGPGCLSNNSTEWLQTNFGPFSALVPLQHLLKLNPDFNPMKLLRLLSPEQSAELLFLHHPILPDKEVIIKMLFDHLTVAEAQKKIPEFLYHVNMYLKQSKGNLSCSALRTLFERMDVSIAMVPPDIAHSINYGKATLSAYIPLGCVVTDGKCNMTMINETDICVGVDSSALQGHLDRGEMSGRFCDFTVREFACASLSALTAEDLVEVLKCKRSDSSMSRPTWKLLLSKASMVLNKAIELLSNETPDLRDPHWRLVLDSIREIRLDLISFNDPYTIKLWFNDKLRPILPAASDDFLSCISRRNMICTTYQSIVQVLSNLRSRMDVATQMSVYTHFIDVFLTRSDTSDPACSEHIHNSGKWLEKNLGGFTSLVSFKDLLRLHHNFSAMEALSQLTVRQLAEVSSTPGQLGSAASVNMVMVHVPTHLLSMFFDDFSPAIMGHENLFPLAVRSAMLQVVFDRADLASQSVSHSAILNWLQRRMRPLLVGLSPLHVAPFFKILKARSCIIEQLGIDELNSTISTLHDDTQTQIHNHIMESLKGLTPLRCYGVNFNHSFYLFLEQKFEGFQFPQLTTFLSLMPPNKMRQLVNTIPPSQLAQLLRRSGFVNDDAELCQIYHNYDDTPAFLETETVPTSVRRPTLPCIWPMAVSSVQRSEVNAWFDRRLHNYLGLLTKGLLTSSATHNASCLAFQKIVSVLNKHSYSNADFSRLDVFDVIRAYLTSATAPKCYNADNADLNSTAWFAEYMGPFISFLTLDDLLTFGSTQVLQVFSVNLANIALLNTTVLPLNLTNFYAQLIYLQDSTFNPMLLPLILRCMAPAPAFAQLSSSESMIVLKNLTKMCASLDPQISAALASTFGDNIDADIIMALGMESMGISTGQLRMVDPAQLYAALSVLSQVPNWNRGQAMSIIYMLMSSGMIKLNSTASLLMLGSLVTAIPAGMLKKVKGQQLIEAFQNPSFVDHSSGGINTFKEVLISQVISVSGNTNALLQNVPDSLSDVIPRSFLEDLTNDPSVIKKLNKKKWKREQAELFFGVAVLGSEDADIGGLNNLSSSVLQGFTCTRVQSYTKVKVRNLVKACRRKNGRKVKLVQSQLTCMYNYVKGGPNVTVYDLYPPDVLLFYSYSLVPPATCRAYFEQLGDADFSVFSPALSYKVTELFDNAKTCLGITGTALTKDQVSVLGNMCCTLDADYITNSDPSILNKLSNCPSLTTSQATAVEALLTSGVTEYGDPSTWDLQTLKDLGMLPLYLSDAFYGHFKKKTKRQFLRYFMPMLRSNEVSRPKRKAFKEAVRSSIAKRTARSADTSCTVGEITQVTINDDNFPLDYSDVTQFNNCLSATTVKNTLAAITDAVDQEDYLAVVLRKLHEAYSGDIQEYQIQVLGPASRVATTEHVKTWTITELDTLAMLMDSSYGQLDPNVAKAIVLKYLSEEGNSLGSVELNTIGGENLCSLDTDTLKNISQDAIRQADALALTSCSLEKKREIFYIAQAAFSATARTTTVSPTEYQLMRSYLGGAPASYVRTLAASNISMEVDTFTSLDDGVVQDLSVPEVSGLLGTNLPDLKLYENDTLVRSWISRQLQSELDNMGVDLMGGREDGTTPAAATPTAGGGTNPANTPTAGGGTNPANTPTAGGGTNPANTPTAGGGTNPAATPIAGGGTGPATTPAGGRTSDSPTPSGNGSTPAASTSSTTTATTGTAVPVRAPTALSLLTLLALLVTSQVILQ